MERIDAFLLLAFIRLLMVVCAEANQSLITCQALKTKLAEWTTKGMEYQESRIKLNLLWTGDELFIDTGHY